jgi:uncharacterized membrane protein YeaQ/YmgE (transglycosylase-associated protein family)
LRRGRRIARRPRTNIARKPYDASPATGRVGNAEEHAVGIISWLIFGALAGWVASMITGNNARQNWIGNIIVGIVGALIGGFLFSLFGGGVNLQAWDLGSFIVAVIGAVVLLLIVGAIQGRRA